MVIITVMIIVIIIVMVKVKVIVIVIVVLDDTTRPRRFAASPALTLVSSPMPDGRVRPIHKLYNLDLKEFDSKHILDVYGRNS